MGSATEAVRAFRLMLRPASADFQGFLGRLGCSERHAELEIGAFSDRTAAGEEFLAVAFTVVPSMIAAAAGRIFSARPILRWSASPHNPFRLRPDQNDPSGELPQAAATWRPRTSDDSGPRRRGPPGLETPPFEDIFASGVWSQPECGRALRHHMQTEITPEDFIVRYVLSCADEIPPLTYNYCTGYGARFINT